MNGMNGKTCKARRKVDGAFAGWYNASKEQFSWFFNGKGSVKCQRF